MIGPLLEIDFAMLAPAPRVFPATAILRTAARPSAEPTPAFLPAQPISHLFTWYQ
jgi:hypothetical protein